MKAKESRPQSNLFKASIEKVCCGGIGEEVKKVSIEESLNAGPISNERTKQSPCPLIRVACERGPFPLLLYLQSAEKRCTPRRESLY